MCLRLQSFSCLSASVGQQQSSTFPIFCCAVNLFKLKSPKLCFAEFGEDVRMQEKCSIWICADPDALGLSTCWDCERLRDWAIFPILTQALKTNDIQNWSTCCVTVPSVRSPCSPDQFNSLPRQNLECSTKLKHSQVCFLGNTRTYSPRHSLLGSIDGI